MASLFWKSISQGHHFDEQKSCRQRLFKTKNGRVQSIWLRIRCWFVQNKLNPSMLCRHLESKCALHPKAKHFCNDFSHQQTIYGSLWSGFLRSSSQFLRPVGFPLESSACRKRSAYASSKCRSYNSVCCCFLGGFRGWTNQQMQLGTRCNVIVWYGDCNKHPIMEGLQMKLGSVYHWPYHINKGPAIIDHL